MRRQALLAVALTLLTACGGGADDGAGTLADEPVESMAPAPAPSVAGEPDHRTQGPTLVGFPAYGASIDVPELAVRPQPDPAAEPTVRLPKQTSNGVTYTLLVKEERLGADGRTWYRVLLPVRPNGSNGWVPAADVELWGVRHKLVVRMAAFKLDLYEDGRLERTYPIGVGTDETPTPGGEYFITELLVPQDTSGPFGTRVFGLSGYSEVLTDWEGGGVLGIHGTDDPDGSIGRRASHGCIRLRNRDVEDLASRLPLGTPVEVQE